MSRSGSSAGLSIGYRIGYRLRLIGLTLFGPAQLGEGNDPKARLERERAAQGGQGPGPRRRRALASAEHVSPRSVWVRPTRHRTKERHG